jgi:hypothetical protein
MKARQFFYRRGQRAASLGRPRWLCHHETPRTQSNDGYWATVAWLQGYDDQSQWRTA